ncbi:hypothetical protein [Kineococcus rhizosphaerae]|uniref:Uncharacterized protein n=1 Tax=Kineococcus rhizosphaerae TaxID=559628 RepID=A0A2T0R1A3_9ACTN|nr:hypothetical protein [Kineococcus rhizosphaerae]PRY13031.1 hypothetical protein CLV37_109222 [Kineococcus rhizosphaerae]
MSRRVLGLDRVVAVLLGLVLLAGGAAAVVWAAGWLRQWWPGAPARLAVADVTKESWFAAAAAVAAVVLAVLALWWLLAHVPRRSVGTLSLPGSGPGGQSRLTASGPVDAAAEEFALTPGVRSASGRTISDRGELLVEFRAVVEPTADLRTVAAASQEVSAQLRQVLGRDDVRGRVRLSVARNDKTRRVH